MIKIFIGYDPREAITFHVCANSIIRHASQPVAIIPLALNLLKDYKEIHTDGSNHSVYSRFLVPHLMDFSGWAIYIDGDMIIRDDIIKLWKLQEEDKAIMVVKHDYQTKTTTKYLDSKNENYPRKNWSSVILWNCSSHVNQKLTPNFIEQSTGQELHRFTWIPDRYIGQLPIEWNWLVDEYGVNNNASLLHFTLGTPCFTEYSSAPMSNEWHEECLLTNYVTQI